MARLRESLMVGAVIWVAVLSLVGQTALGRDVRLVVRPQKIPAEGGKYVLLPPPALLTDGDAVPLYEKAIKTLPPDTDWVQIDGWLAMPLGQLPQQEVRVVLERQRESLDSVARAARCRECKWPKLTTEAVMANLAQYRRLGFAVRLRTRYEIARGNHDGAILVMQTGFGMGRHLAQAPTLIQFIVGVAIAGMMRTEVEEFVQAGEAPNLYVALAALPKPFADVEKAIDSENKVMPSEPPAGGVAREMFESTLKLRAQSDNKTRATAKRLDRDLALWQCLEAIRSHAGVHSGQLPQTLADIKEVSIPKDPVTGEVFRYTRTGTTAVLESPAPAGGDKKDELRYEITVKN